MTRLRLSQVERAPFVRLRRLVVYLEIVSRRRLGQKIRRNDNTKNPEDRAIPT
jgi:hypothetical protein